MFTIFVRNWYKRQYNHFTGSFEIVPHPQARRSIIDTSPTEEGARKLCRQYNETHEPGPLSRKAEYTSNF